jgi:hypothetical protein
MKVETVDVQITRGVWLRCDEAPMPNRGCIVHAIRVDGDTWQPGEVAEQGSAADIAISMGFDCVYVHGEDGTEQAIVIEKFDNVKHPKFREVHKLLR